MAGIPGIRRLFRLPQTEARAPREVSEEIAFHLDMRTEELVTQGLPASEARARAVREFGEVEAAESELTELARRRARQYRRAELHDWLWRDLRYAFRSLRRDALFAGGVILTLALGLGANAAMFGMTDRVLLQPPPHVRDPASVARVYFQKLAPWGELTAQTGFSYAEYRSLRENARLVSLAGWTHAALPVGRGVDAEQLTGLAATANYFALLGVEPQLGRFFTAEEDEPKRAARVVVLGHGYWQRRYGGSTGVLGETLEIGGERFTVIGVAPRGFNGLDLYPVDLFIPASAHAESLGVPDWHETDRVSWIELIGRVGPGVAPAAAVNELTRLHDRHGQAHGAAAYGDSPDEHAVLGPAIAAQGPAFMRGSAETVARTTLLLLGVSLIVLLVACANVANLLLTRALRRARELAIRMALGVGHVRLLSLVLAEALLLAVAGGALGLVLAYYAGGLLAPVLLPGVDWSGGIVAGRVLGFSALLVLGCTLLIALLPAVQALRTDVNTMLRAGVREGGGRRAVVRRGLVVAQASLSIVLLAGAGLFVRSMQKARAIDFGFEGERVVVMTWDESMRVATLPGMEADAARARADSAWVQRYEAAAERVRALPGVESASLAVFVPGRSSMNLAGLITGEGDSIGSMAQGGPYTNSIDTAYFRTLGIELQRGRGFTAADVAGGEPVAVVDEAFAAAVWPGRDPVGRCFRMTRRPDAPAEERACIRVVGEVESAMRQRLDADPAPQFYRPLSQLPIPRRGLFVRSRSGAAEPLVPAVRAAVQQVGPDLPYADVRTLESQFAGQLRPWRIGMTLFIAFGCLALLVAAVGLYSIMAYSVTVRRRELGVRQALGARPGQLLGLVLREAARVLAVGVLLGLALALALAGTVQSLLFQVQARDPVVLALVSVALVVVGITAALLPARRAARVEAGAVLREE